MILNKEDYVYLGKYKAPLLYYSLCQNWFVPKLAKNLPKLKGEILVLDGELFYCKSDWNMIKSRTLKALKDNDKFFADFIRLSKQTIGKVERLSKKKVNLKICIKLFMKWNFPGSLFFQWQRL